jgi:DNA-binding GntR family transcriptional regulator
MDRSSEPHEAQIVAAPPLGRQIADGIRHEILTGNLRPGQTLSQETLCARFGTSRMPVRDALRQLHYEGFLVWLPNNQTQVARFSRDDIYEIFEVHAMLHGRLARRATDRASEEDLDRLFTHHLMMVEAVTGLRLSELWSRNWQFHQEIVELGNSPKFVAALRAVTIEIHRTSLYNTEEQARRSNDEHAAILDAMRSRDGPSVEELMAEHVIEARDSVIGHLTRVGVLSEVD